MLHLNSYFIREHVGLLKLSDTYDILNPETQEQVGIAKEEISGLIKLLRFFIDKRLLPTRVSVYTGAKEELGELQFYIKRGVSIFRPKVKICDSNDQMIGYLKSKLLTIGGAFRVFLPDDQEIALVKGDWKGWNFSFKSGETELGTVTKKWNGLGKELFTSADNYIIHINGEPSEATAILLLAAGLSIDTVLKEKK